MRIRTACVAIALTVAGVLGCAGLASADPAARAGVAGSPGVVSGNVVQVPVGVPINVCGNSINPLLGAFNPVAGGSC